MMVLMMVRTHTCGWCNLPYNSSAMGPESAVCPRCNPGKTANIAVTAALPDTVLGFPVVVSDSLSTPRISFHAHEWADITKFEDAGRGVRVYLCTRLGCNKTEERPA